MEQEILQQILSELKDIKESQAVLEREVKDVKFYQTTVREGIDRLDRQQAVLEKGQAATNRRLDNLEKGQEAIKTSQLIVEHEWFPKMQGALDAYAAQFDKYMAHEKRLTVVENAVEDHGDRLFKLEVAG